MLAYAKAQLGFDMEAQKAFAVAVHEARKITHRTSDDANPHGIASALHKIALNEYRAGLTVEAHAHIHEAWDMIYNQDTEEFVLSEIIGTMAQAGLEKIATERIETFSRVRRRNRLLAFLSKGLPPGSVKTEI